MSSTTESKKQKPEAKGDEPPEKHDTEKEGTNGNTADTEFQKHPFTSHLGELRTRIFVALAAILVLFVVAFQFSEILFKGLTIPMRSNISFLPAYPFITFIPREGAVQELVFLAPAEAFWVHMKVSLIAAIIAASPVIFLQAWKFIAPGLHKTEKRMALPFLFTTTGLFVFGTLFCFLIVLPFAMNFLLNFRTGTLTPMISVEKYVDFCLKFILAFGVVFELPVVIVFLTRTGLITPATLAKNRKYAVLLAFVTAAILTPTPDAFNQTLMAVPIIILYEAGLLASRILAKRRAAHDSREESQGNGD